jgi:hypothetical protein
MSRPYTGLADPVRGRRRVGLERFVAMIVEESSGRVWNNGTLAVRSVRGGSGLSVHATGRAVDLSRRGMGDHRRGCDRATLVRLVDVLVDHAELIGLELVVDYETSPHGRGWKCDRDAWRVYDRATVGGGGAPWADWIHVEISPERADSTVWVDDLRPAIAAVFGATTPPSPPPPPSEWPEWPSRRRMIRLGDSRPDLVRTVQARLAAAGFDPGPVDGKFGPRTLAAVQRFQTARGLIVDGIVGPQTWGALASI